MKSKILMLTMSLALVTLARGATNDLTGLLQKGLFEEEANRDLTAAIANYQSLANAFDKDRQLAATAVFRLGECYRKLGKTNEAVSQYQRLIKEFSDQQTLVTLSRQNLVGLGGSAVPTATPSSQGVSEPARQLAWVKKLQAMPLSEVRQVAPTVLTDATLINLIYQYNQTELDLIRLRADYGEEHPEVQKEKAIQSALKDKIKERLDGMSLALSMEVEASAPTTSGSNEMGGSAALLNLQIKRAQEGIADAQKQLEGLLKMYMPENSQVVALKKKIDAENANLAALTEKLQAMPSAAAESENPITDEEQQEIRRIQLMIQNSPDLINAPDGDGNTPLLLAASKGQLVVAKYLLDHGADVNGRSRHVITPLSTATDNGHKAMVELLLSRGAEVNGNGGRNPLVVAVRKGYVAVAEVLLAHKADVNTPFEGGALNAAAGNGQTELLKLLIEQGADVNLPDSEGRRPLELAAVQNNTNAARLLLASKAAIEAKDKSGNTPLHEAAKAGNAGFVSLLLESGATVDPTNSSDTTPLLLAVANNRTDAARVLLQHKADPNREGRGPSPSDQNQWKRSLPILFAIWKGNDDLVKSLLEAGANPEGESRFDAPLYTAINYNRVVAVQLLLERGADPNRIVGGLRLLNHTLSSRLDIRMARLLLDEGADANAADSQSSGPLFCTTDPEVGRWLVEHKADVNARSMNLTTPLMSAVRKLDYAKFLLEAGAKPDLQDTNGNTALHHAVYSSAPEVVALLLAHKADPNMQNNNGYTPRDLAEAGKQGQNVAPLMGWYGLNSAPSKESAEVMADMLTKAGGLVNLPKRNRIEIRRASNSGVALTKGSHDWNRYSLLELIAVEYKFLLQKPAGEWSAKRASQWSLWNDDFRFPDFKNVVIYRRTDASAKQKAINVNVEDIVNSGDCSRDIWLEWGDVIEIPETDHPVDATWPGLATQTVSALTNCLARHVTINVKGVSTSLELMPKVTVEHSGLNDIFDLTSVSYMLRSVLDNSKLVRVSSDLSRVKVTRIDPQTKKKQEWTIDCTNPNQADLWLRDGDVIDVPEK